MQEVSSEPHNDSKLRKLRVTIERYASEYPTLAKLFGQTLEAFGNVSTIGGSYALTAGIITTAGATVASTPALVSATILGGATYLVHKAGEALGETINYAATKAAEWQTSDIHEQGELIADYSLVGLIGLASIGQIKKGGTAVVSKQWKQKIHGIPQKTGTEGHDWLSLKEGVKKAKDPDVAEVHFDTSLIRITKGKVPSRMRPDVTTVRKDGRITTDEVKSDSQTIPQLREKIKKMQDMLQRAREVAGACMK